MGATGAGDERNHDRRAGEARDSAEGFDALPPDLGQRVLAQNTEGWEAQLRNLAAHVG